MKLVVMLACACGPAATPVIKPPPPANRTVATATHITPERLCTRLGELKTQQCGVFGELDIADCVKVVKDGLDDPSNRPVIEGMGECALELDACGDIVACLGGTQASAQLRACRTKSDDQI